MQKRDNINFLGIQNSLQQTQEARRTRGFIGEAKKHTVIAESFIVLKEIINTAYDSEPEASEKKINQDWKKISELISPELFQEYLTILKSFQAASNISPEHPERELIDLEAAVHAENIEHWITGLLQDVKNKRPQALKEFTPEQAEALRQSCYFFFLATANTFNARSVEKDVQTFFKNKPAAEDAAELPPKKTSDLVQELKRRYQLSVAEAELLIEAFAPKTEDYAFTEVLENLQHVWRNYNLGAERKALTKISLGYLMHSLVSAAGPAMFARENFHWSMILEYLGLEQIGILLDANLKKELIKVHQAVGEQINLRITNSLLFRNFEFSHSQSSTEAFAAVVRGKEAVQQMVRDVVTEGVPTALTVALSLGMIAKINPALGLLALPGIFGMYKMARRQMKEIDAHYTKQQHTEGAAARSVDILSSSLEEARTSASLPSIAEETQRTLNAQDASAVQTQIGLTKMQVLQNMSLNIASAAGIAVSGVFAERGLISNSEVLATFLFTNRLIYPVRQFVDLICYRLGKNNLDIQKMERILGEQDELDLPNGEREKARVGVSSLPDYAIDIKDLGFAREGRQILHGVNLKIAPGEFVIITGQSGGGKSTLLRHLTGLYHPDKGSINIGGVELEQIKKYGPDSIYSIMAYCNQKPQLVPGLTLRENLLLWTQRSVEAEKITAVLTSLNLTKFVASLDMPLTKMSGGELVRLGIARTLLKEPKILILDEPTSGLDSTSAEEVRKTLVKLRETNPDITMICVSHDPFLYDPAFAQETMQGRVVAIEQLSK